jgi:hypothetical protein
LGFVTNNPPPPPPPPSDGFPPTPSGGFPPSPAGGPGFSAAEEKPSGLALAAMILGIVGLFLFFIFLPSLIAFILGLVAASQLKKSGTTTRLGMARAGWIMGAIGMVAFVAVVVVAVVFNDEKAALDLEVGECVKLENLGSSDVEEIGTIPVVDCDETHNGEVFGVKELNPDGDRDYPESDEALAREAFVACQADFEAYVGERLAESDFGIYPIFPNEDSWDEAEGKTICIAVRNDTADMDEPIGN